MAICVTGGSSGLGRAIAERFARTGTDVFINYHANDAAAEEAVAAVEAAGGIPHLVKADVGTARGRGRADRHGRARRSTGSTSSSTRPPRR